MLPANRSSVLDIGARDGYISIILSSYFPQVTALDLEEPIFIHPSIKKVKGDVTKLSFPDNSFDCVVCLEVLEHLKPSLLKIACDEISRVSKTDVIVGVPYKQDIRLGKTQCSYCKQINPPWGHINVFNESILEQLFTVLELKELRYSGSSRKKDNNISCWLSNMAGNPRGTYNQEEPCHYCGQQLLPPEKISLRQHSLSVLAYIFRQIHRPFIRKQSKWLHARFTK